MSSCSPRGLDRAPERGGLPGDRDPGADRWPDRPAQLRNVRGPAGRAVREGAPFGLIMLDLDDFQDVNNSMGHQAGDEERAASPRPCRSRPTPTSCSATAAMSSPSCCRAPTQPVRAAPPERAGAAVRGLRGPVTASVGVATFPADGPTAADVLLAADRACFLAKREGRDRVATAAEGLALAAEFDPRRRPRSTRRSRSRTRGFRAAYLQRSRRTVTMRR